MDKILNIQISGLDYFGLLNRSDLELSRLKNLDYSFIIQGSTSVNTILSIDFNLSCFIRINSD